MFYNIYIWFVWLFKKRYSEWKLTEVNKPMIHDQFNPIIGFQRTTRVLVDVYVIKDYKTGIIKTKYKTKG